MIRTLIVDDESLARDGIRLLLKDETDITIVGEAYDGHHAVNEIERLLPDLVFLDIQMPGLDGFEVLQRIARVHLPALIFVTAYDRYAVEAFEAEAIDYLLKPFSDERFQRALQRARRSLERPDGLERLQTRLMEFLESHFKAPAADSVGAFPRWFTVKDRRKVILVKTSEIDWIDSASNYVQLHARGHAYLLRMTMGELETKLDPRCFVRVHRTAIVNIERVQEIDFGTRGDLSVKLHNGTSLRLSPRYRDSLWRSDHLGLSRATEDR